MWFGAVIHAIRPAETTEIVPSAVRRQGAFPCRRSAEAQARGAGVGSVPTGQRVEAAQIEGLLQHGIEAGLGRAECTSCWASYQLLAINYGCHQRTQL